MNGKTNGLRTWIEIDTKALENNLNEFRRYTENKPKICAVAKSNAYGHSLVDYSKHMEKLGVDFFAVDSITEALTLRKEGIKIPILVLGHTLPERLEEAVENNISLTASSFDGLEHLEKFTEGHNPKIHIKIDTGMHRQGFQLEDMEKVFEKLKNNKGHFTLEGVYTHFAMAKNPAFPSFTKRQIGEFEVWKKKFEDSGYKVIFHASATSGTLLYPEAHYDMVRIGIGLYGEWPSVHVEGYTKSKINLKPAMSWKTVISENKNINKGETVGYDCTETLARDSKIAVCPIGYWHGYPRALSAISWVNVGGKKAKILGRVAMDMIVIDLTDIENVKVGDEVELLGKGDTCAPTATELGVLADTINYEIITRTNPLIRKIYV